MSLKTCTVVTGGSFSPSGASPQAQTLTGAKVGDIVFDIYTSSGSPFSNPYISYFESTISVDDEIQQTSGPNLSSDGPMTVILFRPLC